MDIVILRLLLRMVEQGIVISFRVTRDKVYIIIKNNRPRCEVTPKIWTKNIRLYGNEYGTQPGSFLLI